MARIRTVKPELFRHEGLYEAELKSGLPLRLAFIGLFTVVDREGRFRWQPRQIKLDIMPYDLIDFGAVLDALNEHGFIDRYDIDKDSFGSIPSWSRHQIINQREQRSVIPPPPGFIDKDQCMHVHARGEGKGREGEREGKGIDICAFDTFWAAYPRKESKVQARKAWMKLGPTAELVDTILAALSEHKISRNWMKDGGQYIPHASTWLNQQRWQDEVKHGQQGTNGSDRGLSLVDQVRERNRINAQREDAFQLDRDEGRFFTFDGEVVGADD